MLGPQAFLQLKIFVCLASVHDVIEIACTWLKLIINYFFSILPTVTSSVHDVNGYFRAENSLVGYKKQALCCHLLAINMGRPSCGFKNKLVIYCFQQHIVSETVHPRNIKKKGYCE